MVAKRKGKNDPADMERSRRLHVPVEIINKLSFPDGNPLSVDDSAREEMMDEGIETIIGKKTFEMIVKTGNAVIGEITLEIDESGKIMIYNDEMLFKTTPELPRLCEPGSITSRYNHETRILSITGYLRDKTIKVERAT